MLGYKIGSSVNRINKNVKCAVEIVHFDFALFDVLPAFLPAVLSKCLRIKFLQNGIFSITKMVINSTK